MKLIRKRKILTIKQLERIPRHQLLLLCVRIQKALENTTKYKPIDRSLRKDDYICI